jgi:hypothetical protein
MSLADLFEPPVIRPDTTRTVNLLVDEPPPRPGRKFFGPPKPKKPYRRTPEQNREKYARYLNAHGRDHINALRREARKADRA